MREELRAHGAPDTVVDDAVLVLSELLSNSSRHARPLRDDASVRASWSRDPEGGLTISVTDGGGPTRPLPATPSVSARGGRGLAIIGALARDWGVVEESDVPQDESNDQPKGVTVWVILTPQAGSVDDGRTAVGTGSTPADGGRPRRHGRHGRSRRAAGSHGAGVGGRPEAHSGDVVADNLAFDMSSVEELR